MEKKIRENIKRANSVGFVACYRGKEIAFARDFGTLAKKSKVKVLLGKKDFIIKHNVPEGMIAVY